MSENRPEGAISVELAAKLIKRSTRHFLRLVAAGWIKKNDAGHYTAVNVIHGFVDYADDQIKRASQAASKNEATAARADEIRLKIAIKQREYSKTDDMVAAIDLLLAVIRESIVGIPAAFTRDRVERAKLQEIVNGALNRIADRCDRTSADLQKGRIILSPASADNKRRVGKRKSKLSNKRTNSRSAKPEPDSVQGADQPGD